MNGTLYDRALLPPEVAILSGTSLGISAFCHVRENVLLRSHLSVLERAAGALGYTGFDVGRAAEAVAAVVSAESPDALVALVPVPPDHKSSAPGDDWMLVVQPFVPTATIRPLRLVTSTHPRNHRSPTASLLLLGDGELLEGSRRAAASGHDEALWHNLDGAIACAGSGAIFAVLDDRIVTPPLADGVPESAWRAAVVAATGAIERRIDVGTLRGATSVACVWPWGASQAVASVDDDRFPDPSLAARIGRALAEHEECE